MKTVGYEVAMAEIGISYESIIRGDRKFAASRPLVTSVQDGIPIVNA